MNCFVAGFFQKSVIAVFTLVRHCFELVSRRLSLTLSSDGWIVASYVTGICLAGNVDVDTKTVHRCGRAEWPNHNLAFPAVGGLLVNENIRVQNNVKCVGISWLETQVHAHTVPAAGGFTRHQNIRVQIIVKCDWKHNYTRPSRPAAGGCTHHWKYARLKSFECGSMIWSIILCCTPDRWSSEVSLSENIYFVIYQYCVWISFIFYLDWFISFC